MNKTLTLMAALAISAMTSSAVSFMCFYTTTGGDLPEAVVSEGLVITVDGDNLVATPREGSALSLPLNTLTGMEFSDTDLGVEEILQTAGAVEIYSLDGLSLGTYPSLEAASDNLPQGIYAIKANGKTVKILIGK